jgi:hypothetical protein
MIRKINLNIVLVGVSLNFCILFNSCGLINNRDQTDKPLTEKEMMKKLHKEEKKQHKIARKAAEKAKKDFWRKQSPEVKRRIKETYKRDKKLRNQSLKKRKK